MPFCKYLQLIHGSHSNYEYKVWDSGELTKVCVGVFLPYYKWQGAMERASSANHLPWGKLVNRPCAKTEKMRTFPDLRSQVWRACGTVHTSAFLETLMSWLFPHSDRLSSVKYHWGPGAGDSRHQHWACNNILLSLKCSPFRLTLFPRLRQLCA